MISESKRYGWIDCLKLVAVYSVYLCHAPGLGRIGFLAIAFQLPCFFFASGFFALNAQKYSPMALIANKFIRTMVPYFSFSIVSLAMRVVFYEYSLGEIIAFFGDMLYASRTRVAVTALWFFPCLFIMSVIYYFLRRLIKNPIVLTLLCFGLSAAVKLIHEAPTLPWGVDQAVRFIIYFCIGDMTRRVIEDGRLIAFFKKNIVATIITVTAISALSAYLMYVNFYYRIGYFTSLIGIEQNYVMTSAAQFFYNIVYLVTAVLISVVLARIPILCKAGSLSAAIIGTEHIIKTLLPLFFTSIGIAFPELQTPPEAVVLSALYVALAYFIFAKPIDLYLPEMLGKRIKRSV